MIGYKLKNTTQFNLNCELAMKFLKKIDTIKFVKTNCSHIYDIAVDYNSINLKIGYLTINEDYNRYNRTFIKFIIKNTNYSQFGMLEIDLMDLFYYETDGALQKIVKFLNEYLSWEVK